MEGIAVREGLCSHDIDFPSCRGLKDALGTVARHSGNSLVGPLIPSDFEDVVDAN